MLSQIVVTGIRPGQRGVHRHAQITAHIFAAEITASRQRNNIAHATRRIAHHTCQRPDIAKASCCAVVVHRIGHLCTSHREVGLSYLHTAVRVHHAAIAQKIRAGVRAAHRHAVVTHVQVARCRIRTTRKGCRWPGDIPKNLGHRIAIHLIRRPRRRRGITVHHRGRTTRNRERWRFAIQRIQTRAQGRGIACRADIRVVTETAAARGDQTTQICTRYAAAINQTQRIGTHGNGLARRNVHIAAGVSGDIVITGGQPNSRRCRGISRAGCPDVART